MSPDPEEREAVVSNDGGPWSGTPIASQRSVPGLRAGHRWHNNGMF